MSSRPLVITHGAWRVLDWISARIFGPGHRRTMLDGETSITRCIRGTPSCAKPRQSRRRMRKKNRHLNGSAEPVRFSPAVDPPLFAQPGPGLFDSPLSGPIVVERWKRLRPLYGQILRGWVANYEHLQSRVGDGGNYGLDYPPLRLLVITFWTWDVQTKYPGLNNFPRTPRRMVDLRLSSGDCRNNGYRAAAIKAQRLLRRRVGGICFPSGVALDGDKRD